MAKKEKVKVSKTFSITKTLFEDFVKYCEQNDINKSKVVEKLIKEWLEERRC